MFWMAKVPDNNSEVYDVGDRRLTTDIHRQCNAVRIRTSRERERTEELHHRIEPFLLAGGTAQRLVAADTQYLREFPGVGTDHVIVQIPCFDTFPEQILSYKTIQDS